MNKRALLAALAAGTLSMTALLMASPADADEDGCTITDILPEQAVIGISGKRVQFAVPTDCDNKDIKFAVRGDLVSTSPHVAWFAACNYDIDSGPEIYDCEHDGSGVINPIGGRTQGYTDIAGNDIAGENNIYAYAFVDANHNNKDDDEPACDIEDCEGNPKDRDQDTGVIELLRGTQWRRTFNAGPEPRRKGQNLRLTATLWTADWNSGQWRTPTATVKIQFKGVGESSYRSVKTVTAKHGDLDFTTKAVRSGYWRVWYPGTDEIAGVVSNSDYVKVNPAKKTATIPTATPSVKPTVKPTTKPTSVPTTTTKPPSTTTNPPSTTTDDPTTDPDDPTTEPVVLPTSAGPAQGYDNCTAMHVDYTHGVRQAGGHDSAVSDSLIPVLPAVYAANTSLDRDKDGVACEA